MVAKVAKLNNIDIYAAFSFFYAYPCKIYGVTSDKPNIFYDSSQIAL